MQEVHKVEDEGVASDHPCIQWGGPLTGVIHMQHVQVLVPGHLPRCHSSGSIHQQVESAIVVPAEPHYHVGHKQDCEETGHRV